MAMNVTRGKTIRCASETILRNEGVRFQQQPDDNGDLSWRAPPRPSRAALRVLLTSRIV